MINRSKFMQFIIVLISLTLSLTASASGEHEPESVADSRNHAEVFAGETPPHQNWARIDRFFKYRSFANRYELNVNDETNEDPFAEKASFTTNVPLSAVSPATEQEVGIRVSLDNPTDTSILLSFGQGHELDVFILNEQGEVLRQWSEGKYFFVGPHDVEIAADSTHDFIVNIELTDRSEQPLTAGNYKLRLVLDGYINDQSETEQQPLYFAEYPLVLR